ncbi:hypothetical protein B566_EDAN008964 [Ephemera danica]|nr:hypothetical protein B566_EDAN008964 [Ephemera danica]
MDNPWMNSYKKFVSLVTTGAQHWNLQSLIASPPPPMSNLESLVGRLNFVRRPDRVCPLPPLMT